jgi:hypothetical protein
MSWFNWTAVPCPTYRRRYWPLSPSMFIYQRTSRLPEQEPWREEDSNLRKRAKHLRSCKDALWKRWTAWAVSEGITWTAQQQSEKVISPAVGEVVIVRSDEKNRGKWPLCIVQELFPGRDGIVRAIKLRCGRSHLERAAQHFYPLKLKYEAKKPSKGIKLDPVISSEARCSSGCRIESGRTCTKGQLSTFINCLLTLYYIFKL